MLIQLDYVAIVEHLHNGKTFLIDTFVAQTYPQFISYEADLRFTDICYDEQERKISKKCTPVSLVLPNSKDKSYLVNLIDTPGQPNITDEICLYSRLNDSALLVVDCIEGTMMQNE